MPARPMLHETDPRQNILDAIGNLDDYELFHNQVLCAVYMRPEKTKSGLILTDTTRAEDAYQGKVALVVKKGPTAFVADDQWDFADIEVGDWVFFRISDGWSQTVNQVLCRVVRDTQVLGRIQNPDQVW